MRAFGRGAARSGPNGSRRPLGLLLLPFRRNVSAPGAVRRIARHAIAALTVLRCCRPNPNDKSQNDQKHRHGYLRIRYQLRRRQLGSAESARLVREAYLRRNFAWAGSSGRMATTSRRCDKRVIEQYIRNQGREKDIPAASTLYSRLNQRTSIINAPALCAGSVFLRRTILPCIGLNDGLPLFVTSTRPGRLYAICGFEGRSRKPIERQGVPSGAQAHVENSVLSSRDFLRYATPARRARWTTEVYRDKGRQHFWRYR